MMNGNAIARVAFFAMLLAGAGCGKKSTTVVASCNRPGTMCTDYYVTVEAVVRDSCENTHGGTFAEARACDRTGAVVGCQTTDSVRWFYKRAGDTEQSVKDEVGRICTPLPGDEGIVSTGWQPKP